MLPNDIKHSKKYYAIAPIAGSGLSSFKLFRSWALTTSFVATGFVTGSLGLTTLAISTSVYAEAASQVEHRFQIAPGSLDSAIAQLGQQSKVMVSVSGNVSRNKQVLGVSGIYSVTQALDMLLKGTGLQAVKQTNGSFIVVNPLPKGDTTMVLDPVEVQNSLTNDHLASINTNVSVAFDEIKKNQPADLKEIFKNETAVEVGGSIALNQKIYLRGVEETALSVQIDGARQNNKIFHHNATNIIDPALLKSVRASAGISPADDGPGAIGGSLIFETVDVADLLAPNDPLGGFVKAGFNTNSKTLNTGGAIYGQKNGFEALVYLNRAAGDDYKDGKGDRVKYTEADLVSGLGKVAYSMPDSNNRFELSYESVNDATDRPYRANLLGIIGGRPTPESREYDLQRTNLIFNYSNQGNDGLWNPNVVISNSETELATTEVPLSAPDTKVVYTGIADSQSLVLENLFAFDFANITAGLDHYNDSTTFKYKGDPDLSEEAKNIGVFAQFRQEIDAIRLSYGLRYDNQDFTGVDRSKHSDSGVSANVFAEFDATQYLTLKAGYASVWGGVALTENFILNPKWDYSKGVKAVESDNYVVGFEGRLSSLLFGANIYKTEIANGRVASYRKGPGLVADFEVSGHDVYVSYLSDFYELNLKYSNIDADKDGVETNSYDGQYFTSPLGATVTLSGSAFMQPLPLELGFSIEHARENKFIAFGEEGIQENFTIVNLSADYQIKQNMDLRFAVNNFFDEQYTDRATYGQEFPKEIKTFLEPGRSFILSGRVAF